ETAVPVLEPDDVLDLRRGHLEDRRVLERRQPVHRSRPDAKCGSGADHLDAEGLFPRLAQLELRAAGVDEPRFVLLAVELEAERLARLDEEELAAVVVRQRPDQLMSPRLVYLRRLDRERVEALEVRRGGLVAHAASHSGCARRCSSATRRSFGVFTVSQTPSCRCAKSLPSAASSGRVVVSRSPRSGSRSSASWSKTFTPAWAQYGSVGDSSKPRTRSSSPTS